jgi:hypothetical protein
MEEGEADSVWSREDLGLALKYSEWRWRETMGLGLGGQQVDPILAGLGLYPC